MSCLTADPRQPPGVLITYATSQDPFPAAQCIRESVLPDRCSLPAAVIQDLS